MDIKLVRFLREVLISDRQGNITSVIEFSYDDRFVRRQRFFGVPDLEEAQARQLYLAWGGSRPEGCRFGATVGRPESRAGL